MKRIHACSHEDCGNEFKYGDLVVRGPNGPLCEHCAKKHQVRGEAVVYGGQKTPSSVERDCARRKLKKLARATRRAEELERARTR